MRTLFSLTAAVAFCGTISAQGVITRLNGGQSYFRYDGNVQAVLDEASLEADVDTIILGGGTYVLPNNQDLVVNSRVVIIGSGLSADSSVYYGGRTTIQPSAGYGLRFVPGSDGSELHGITFSPGGSASAYLRIGTGTLPSTAVNDILIKRCRAYNITLGHQNQSLAQGARIEECVLDNVDFDGSVGAYIWNSYLNTVSSGTSASNCEIRNCLFLNWLPSGNVGNIYRDNIFLANYNSDMTINEASTFHNNLYVGSGAAFNVSYGANVLAQDDQLAETSMNDALVNVPVPGGFSNFSFFNNYRVTALYQGSGSDGSDPGTYGGPSPWKEGSIPFNPHWSELNGPSSTNSGVLQDVIIRGSAQTH